eukprot:11882571-Karenia_brevis.AAC.1
MVAASRLVQARNWSFLSFSTRFHRAPHCRHVHQRLWLTPPRPIICCSGCSQSWHSTLNGPLVERDRGIPKSHFRNRNLALSMV